MAHAFQFPLVHHPVETVDEQGNEFVFSSAKGGLVALSSLPAHRRREEKESAADAHQEHLLELDVRAQIFARRRQIRCGVDELKDGADGDSESASTASSGVAVSSLSTAAAAAAAAADSTTEAAPLRHLRAAAVRRAIDAVNAALQEVEALSRSDTSTAKAATALLGPPGALDLLFVPPACTRLVLAETTARPPAAGQAAASPLTSTALSTALRLKRKRQQLAAASGVLRSSAELLAAAAAAQQRTAADLSELRRSWRVETLAAGRLLTSADALAVDCSLATAGAPPRDLRVGLSGVRGGGLFAAAPHLQQVAPLVLSVADQSGAAAGHWMSLCTLADALGPSLRGGTLAASGPLAAVHDGAVGRELLAELRACALASPNRRWLAGAGGTALSVRSVGASSVEVEVRPGTCLRVEVLTEGPSATAAATSTTADAADAAGAADAAATAGAGVSGGPHDSSLARLLLCCALDLLLSKWQRPLQHPSEAPKPQPNAPPSRFGAGLDSYAKTNSEIFGTKKKRRVPPGSTVGGSGASAAAAGAPDKAGPRSGAGSGDVLAALVAAARHALLARDVEAALRRHLRRGGRLEGPLGAPHWAPAESRFLVRGAVGWCLPLTIDGARNVLVADMAGCTGGRCGERDLKEPRELAALCEALDEKRHAD